MLSVLIPVYNFAIGPLVKGLQIQCLAAQIEFEIICFDDCSAESFDLDNQRELADLPGVIYQRLPENVGRSSIRNQLAEAANYPYLLFMDCDSGLVSQTYISQYIEHLHPHTILYGGRVYDKTPPDNPALHFHWYYGRHREQMSVTQRQQQPYHSFMTNNFLIPKEVFQQIKFDESLRQYGHEDTLFGLELARREIPIIHLDNPLEHLGLESQEVFLRKSQQAVVNLFHISEENNHLSTRLLDTYKGLKYWHLSGISAWILSRMEPLIVKRLASPQPNLFFFDLYKLALLLALDRGENKKK